MTNDDLDLDEFVSDPSLVPQTEAEKRAADMLGPIVDRLPFQNIPVFDPPRLEERRKEGKVSDGRFCALVGLTFRTEEDDDPYPPPRCSKCGKETDGQYQLCGPCGEKEEYDFVADDLAFDAARERAAFGGPKGRD